MHGEVEYVNAVSTEVDNSDYLLCYYLALAEITQRILVYIKMSSQQ